MTNHLKVGVEFKKTFNSYAQEKEFVKQGRLATL